MQYIKFFIYFSIKKSSHEGGKKGGANRDAVPAEWSALIRVLDNLLKL
jgi:hypothetical protein